MDEALRLYDYGTKGTLVNVVGFRIRNHFQNVVYEARFWRPNISRYRRTGQAGGRVARRKITPFTRMGSSLETASAKNPAGSRASITVATTKSIQCS